METLKNIKIVIFDCDGVMFDTLQANRAYYNWILNHFGKSELTTEQLTYVHMHTADAAITYLFGSESNFKEVQTYYRENMSYVPFLKYMKIEPYLKQLLKKLRPKYKTAIATNRTNTMSPVLVEHKLEDFFDIVVRASDVKQPKPHPEALFKILKYFNVKPSDAIYIGDSKVDETASIGAQIPFVSYKNTDLHSANFHIKESLKELEDILKL